MLTLTPRFTGSLPEDLPKSLYTLYEQSPTLARLFLARGIKSSDELDYSLSSLLSANRLLHIDKAMKLLDSAIDAKKRILIVGDFDCDGATSTALMMRVLGDMGADINFVVPDRFKYGYGLTPEIVQLGIDKYSPDVIVTVDNGISSHEGVDKAKAHGITVIITDHHLTTKPTPDADAVVNPNQLGCSFDSKSLVGVGVAFYLLGRLAKFRRQHHKSSVQVSKYLDLVALGTIADVGVLDHNNRVLVQHGLNAIRQGNCSLGILAILEQAGRDFRKMTVQDFGFVIGPRINAAGRMDSMRIGIDCLMTDDLGEAQRLAYQLDKLNKERRRVEGEMREQADKIVEQIEQNKKINAEIDVDEKNHLKVEVSTSQGCTDKGKSADGSIGGEIPTITDKNQNRNYLTNGKHTIDNKPRSIILYQDSWHQGVIGIVAGRLKETYYRPSIVFAPADSTKLSDNDVIKGSARSIPDLHIRDAIELIAESNPQLISHFGGHAMAAGLTIKKKNFVPFVKAFDELMNNLDATIFEQEKFTDGQLMGSDFSLHFADTINNGSIWGHGFVPPLFDGVFDVASFKILKDKHLKLSLNYPDVLYPIDAIWFNYDNDKWDYRATQVHILYELDINEWNGNQNVQLMVKDLSVTNKS